MRRKKSWALDTVSIKHKTPEPSIYEVLWRIIVMLHVHRDYTTGA
jgi:hypothetical protein